MARHNSISVPFSVLRLTAAAALLALVSACASGGGGGSAGGGGGSGGPITPPTPPTPPTPTDPPPVEFDPGEFETGEYDNTEGLAYIGASAAYSRSATGEGITIAVIDTGTDATHPELEGQVLSTSFDIYAGERQANDIDPEGHGTLVSGVIAAKRNFTGVHGVAFESRILDIRADQPGTCLEQGEDQGCSFVDPGLVEAINRAVNNGAQIINLSLGGVIDQDQSLENAIRNAVAEGVLFVIAAGNEAEPAGPDPDNPGQNLPAQGQRPNEPAYIAGQAGSLGRVVAVGSIDVNPNSPTFGKISDFSNRAGEDSQNFYLLAPGEGVVTTGPDGDNDGEGDYYRVAGTSFAAPYVSGALALMLQSFPNLDTDIALQILLDTADDYVDTAIDPITGTRAGQGTDIVSGVGVLNLEAAFTPQGASTMSFGAEQVELAEAMAPAGGAFGDWAMTSGAFDNLVFQDVYGRGFRIDTASLQQAGSVMTSLERRADWLQGQGHAVSTGNLSLSWAQAAVREDPNLPYEPEPETVYQARYAFSGGLVEFGRGGRLESIAPRVSLTEEVGSPSALGGSGSWARITRDVGKFSVDAFSANNEVQDVSGVGISRRGHGWVTRAAVSSMENGRSALGSTLQSRFGGEDRTSLTAYNFEAAMRPVPGLTVSAGVEAAAISLAGVEARNVWTSRWSVGAETPVPGGTLSFVVAQPRRAESGQITFDGPVAITKQGDLVYDTINAGLSPSGRQVDLETRWSFALSERVSGSAAVALSTAPNHIAGAERERAFWLGVRGDL